MVCSSCCQKRCAGAATGPRNPKPRTMPLGPGVCMLRVSNNIYTLFLYIWPRKCHIAIAARRCA